ncbi:MAG: substrate-binding domain-containing protein [Chloroflexi bacterium]|nr:substrate-binding domain-containing protein [Chloroflexota bacterium]
MPGAKDHYDVGDQAHVAAPAEGSCMLARYRTHLLIAIAVAAAVALTTVVNQFAFGPAQADSHNQVTTEVRISAKQLADGRVEFALQQWNGSQWGERILPRPRLFPANSPVDLWRNSGRIEVQTPLPAEPMPSLCVVANGDSDKLFWQFVEFHASRAANLIGVKLDYSTHTNVDDRVDAIEQCVDDGARMILATLADADQIIPALEAAAEHGVQIASFGAGEEHADRAGSLIHVSMDEAAAGRRAAEQFNSAAVAGPVLCVIHHDAYAARKNICTVLEEEYTGGDVEQLQLGAEDADEQIESALRDNPDVAGLLVLEADLLPDAIRAIEDSDNPPFLGSIGEYPLSKLGFAKRDLIRFTVMDLARFEVLLAAAALHYMYANHPNARFFEGAMIFDGTPNVHIGGPKGGHGRPSTDDGHGHDHDH